jgi:hypothetical protein
MGPNARIEDVLDTLAEPVGYLRGIIGSFVEFSFDKAVSVVRIGTSGRGIFSNYVIETPCQPDPNRMNSTVTKRHVFNGRSHREMLDEDTPQGEHWSSAVKTFLEVQALLGQYLENSRRF